MLALRHQPASLYLSIICSLFTLYFSSLRIFELWKIPQDAELAPGYPTWLLNYLWGVIGSLGIISLIGIYYEILIISNILKRRWLLVPAVCLVLWIGARSYYLLQDPDVGNGGIVWGAYDVLTLTRNVATANEAGKNGYRIGQIIGLVVFFTMPLIFAYCAMTELAHPQGSRDEPSDAPRSPVSPEFES
ncbi:MAG: hypothetical protein MUC43_16260 [Pirellula sp.]|jgi:hypothetical protein|nr:hypothetical protein [Pirellula sp.]